MLSNYIERLSKWSDLLQLWKLQHLICRIKLKGKDAVIKEKALGYFNAA